MFKFRLLHYTWGVNLVKSTDERLTLDNSLCLGLCDSREFIIYINKELPPQCLLRVLRHELSHAMIYTCLENTDFGNEKICDYMADYAPIILQIEQDFKKHHKIA